MLTDYLHEFIDLSGTLSFTRETMNKSPERPQRGRSGRAGYGRLACRWLGK